VLVLDEPTNDLDIESLELLEQTLQEYPGTLLLVSHDRAFLDNVVTQTLAVEGDGQWREYVGGYGDWLRQRPAPVEEKTAGKPPRETVAAITQKPRIKLSFKERRELEALPVRDRGARGRAEGDHGSHEPRRLLHAGRAEDQGRSSAQRRDRNAAAREARTLGSTGIARRAESRLIQIVASQRTIIVSVGAAADR
jgi:ATPase subunit of ABC transporter with duplicated ATPase domains